ncbi:MAG: glutamate--tRNA ligase, partial [Cyclobacteriaceae bacterium]|nr:glutamate--tRNA ligase [Cyclobacteriaceae bacterium]
LIEAFSLDRIVKSGAKFDISKAQWFNQQYIRELPVSELENHLREKLKDHGHDANDEKLKAVVNLLAERITFADDLWQQGKILFEAPAQYDMALAQKKWNPEAAEFLQNYQKALDTLKVFDSDHLHQLLKEQLEAVSWGFGKVMPSLRLALTGEGRGPDLMKIMEILGKDETGDRISWAVEKLAHIN